MTSATARSNPERRWGPADAPALNRLYANRPADALADALTRPEFAPAAIVSSFGAESAILLHMASRIAPHTPILFIDTGRLFPETLDYADALATHLGLTNIRRLHPDPATLAVHDPKRLRWSYDPDGCCAIRKVAPLDTALSAFALSITGRKRHQAHTRANLQLFEADGPRLKLNPLADWTAARLQSYAATHQLPPHPLQAQGYPSIGCSPCTSRVQAHEDPRAGRWRGWDKTECGIHTPATDPAF